MGDSPFMQSILEPKSGGRRRDRGRQRAKDITSIAGTQQIFAGALRMRHQADPVAWAIAGAGNILARAVRIRGVSYLSVFVAVTKHDSVIALEFSQGQIITNIIAFGMRNRNSQDRAALQLVRERRIRSVKPDEDVFANEMQIAVADQGARQQSGFAKNLKAVADSQHQAATVRELFDRIHDR